MLVLIVAAVFNIASNILFIPKYSYWAAAYNSIGTELIVVTLTLWVIIKHLKYVPKMEKFTGVLLAGFFMAAFLAAFRGANFFLQALGSVGTYFTFLWVFKTVKTSEITSLISKKGIEEYAELP